MNIILTSFYYKPHFGGVENSLYHLAQEYRQSGNSVCIVCSDAGLDKKNRLPARELLDGIEIYRFRSFIPKIGLFHLFAPLTNIYRCKRVAVRIKKEGPDAVVISRHFITGIAFIMAGFKNVKYLIPGVVAFQDKLPLKYTGVSPKQLMVNLFNRLFILPQNCYLQRMFMKGAHKIFVFSNNMERQVAAILGKDKRQINIVKPGVDLNRFAKYGKTEARGILEIPKDSFVLLCLGRITVHKGFDIALKSLALLNKDIKPLLLIVGDGPEKPSLKTMAESLRISDFVKFYDKTDFPELYYSASDVFLMTSVSETFGQTVIEAFAARLPVIAFKPNEKNIITSMDELILNYETGIIIEHSDKKMTEAIQLLIKNKELYKAIQKNAAEEIYKYSWFKLAKCLLMRSR